MVNSFNSKIRPILDTVASHTLKKTITNPTPPWQNEKTRQLKRNFRKAKRRWRKDNLTMNYQIYRNNLKILFPTIGHLINPVFMKSSSESSISKCEDFADRFRSKTMILDHLYPKIRISIFSLQNLYFHMRKH